MKFACFIFNVNCVCRYDELAQKSSSIPLSHLGCCKEGGKLFSELCMWVDINQQYVELGLFPQWDDIARELRIDQMKTDWVRVCVRPEQSFTRWHHFVCFGLIIYFRAILEIYMADGGTLGEVIMALRKQKQFRIIQEISDRAEEFIDIYNTYHKNNFTPDSNSNVHIYSILKESSINIKRSQMRYLNRNILKVLLLVTWIMVE